MGILQDFAEKNRQGMNPEVVEQNLNTLYGYTEDEEKKNEMLKQFIQYLRESKMRDQARLQQSRML